MVDILVSIVVYHTEPAILERCISSILQETLLVRVVVIDNSTDNTLERSCQKLGVEYFHLLKNVGYGTGHNVAIENSIVEKIPYHLVINPDVYFSAGVLSELKKFCDADKKIGLITPKVLYPDGCIQHNCRLIPSFFDLFIRRFLPKNWFSNYRIKSEFRFSNYDTIMEVPFISGCFMFFQTAALKQIGQFDERFFLYMEDVDISRRMYAKYKNIYFPKVSVFHDCQRSSYHLGHAFLYHVHSALKYFCKWGFIFDKERSILNKRALDFFKNSYQFHNEGKKV
ncbi:MAG TPA: glycosyltransferase family 2 protein [Planctomycetota bacterium]|nr:glycosyltransferase family 2 protein [Planctomycetota bacterium]HRU51196.1 glycosyltransferase family 2 protein [Planctomycetota bacterium]